LSTRPHGLFISRHTSRQASATSAQPTRRIHQLFDALFAYDSGPMSVVPSGNGDSAWNDSL
jgi:hypothetical protein